LHGFSYVHAAEIRTSVPSDYVQDNQDADGRHFEHMLYYCKLI